MLQPSTPPVKPAASLEQSLLQLDLIAHTLMHPSRVEDFLMSWTRGATLGMHEFFASETLQLRASREIVTHYRLPVLRPDAADRAWKMALLQGWSGVRHVLQWLQQALLARWARVCIDGSSVRLLRQELGDSIHAEACSLWPALPGWTPPPVPLPGAVEQCRLSATATLAQVVHLHAAPYAAWWRLSTPAADDAVWTDFRGAPGLPGIEQVRTYGSFDAVDWTALEETMHQTFLRSEPVH